MTTGIRVDLHGLAGEWIDDLLGVKVLLPIGVLLEQFSGTVTQEFVARHLNLESARIPSIVQFKIVRVDKGHFLIYDYAISLRVISHLKCLLGALAARMFYFKCKLQDLTRKGGKY